MLGILPFFHSFGFTVTIWTALCLGKKVVYHFNPLDARTIGKLCEEHKVTLLIGHAVVHAVSISRAASRGSSRRSTHLILGAEKLKPEFAREIQADAGHRAAGGLRLHGALAGRGGERAQARCGSATDGRSTATGWARWGCRCPARRSRRSTRRPARTCPPGTEGMIAVKGPQVMVGYLNRPEATAQVLKRRLVCHRRPRYVDPDGFLRDHRPDQPVLEDRRRDGPAPARSSRRSWRSTGVDEHHVAVTGVPDPKHGETTLRALHRPGHVAGRGPSAAHGRAACPKLWIPSLRDFIHVDADPDHRDGQGRPASTQRRSRSGVTRPPAVPRSPGDRAMTCRSAIRGRSDPKSGDVGLFQEGYRVKRSGALDLRGRLRWGWCFGSHRVPIPDRNT